MAEKKSFLIYKSWAPMVEAMSNDQAGMLFKAVFEYQLTGEEPPKGASFYPMFALFKATFEADQAAYRETCETNRRIAEDRKRTTTKHNEPSRTVTTRNEPLRSATDNDNDIDKDNDKDIDKDKDNDKDIKVCGQRASAFVPPTVPEVQDYCRERQNHVDAQRFVDFYAAKGWVIGKNKMKDWRAAVRTWERNSTPTARSGTTEHSVMDEWANA